MWEFDCGIVPLIGDDGRLEGVIADRDVCMAAYTQGKPLAEIPVASEMSKHVIACRDGDTVDTAEHLMRDNRIGACPCSTATIGRSGSSR